MGDVIFVVITVGFFGLCVLMVKGCERIIGPDAEEGEPTPVEADLDASAKVTP